MSPALSAGLTVFLESKGEKVGASLSWGICRGQEAERNPKGNGAVAAESLGLPNPWHLHGPTSLTKVGPCPALCADPQSLARLLVPKQEGQLWVGGFWSQHTALQVNAALGRGEKVDVSQPL